MEEFLHTLDANRNGQAGGIYSVCSAHPQVIEAAMEQAISDETSLLIEATANQVNQYGGYTGMTARDFHHYVKNISEKTGLPMDRIILGGDHLGPVCWQNEVGTCAMEKAHHLIKDYIRAGFKKIHLDCSMPCADDEIPLNDNIVATRAAELCKTAEDAATALFGKSDIIYVIGTEVPPPGGTNEKVPEVEVTQLSHAQMTIDIHKTAFDKLGLSEAWQRVIGLVVQPGVEFSHTTVVQYDPKKAILLKSLIANVNNIVFEAHSTDYQLAANYKLLVEDHFAILKVGPQLTFALREALYALSQIEDILIDPIDRSNLRRTCETEMVASPSHWEKFYQVEPAEQYFYRHYSYSDRIRYYWPKKTVSDAVEKMISNLDEINIPLPLISQFLPIQYDAIRRGLLKNSPTEIIKSKIKSVLQDYAAACCKK